MVYAFIMVPITCGIICHSIPLQLEYGESITVTGSHAELGNWTEFKPLQWSQGHIWTMELDLPTE